MFALVIHKKSREVANSQSQRYSLLCASKSRVAGRAMSGHEDIKCSHADFFLVENAVMQMLCWGCFYFVQAQQSTLRSPLLCRGPLNDVLQISQIKGTKRKKIRRCRGSNPGHPRDRREYSPLYYNDLVGYKAAGVTNLLLNLEVMRERKNPMIS